MYWLDSYAWQTYEFVTRIIIKYIQFIYTVWDVQEWFFYG